MTRKCKHGNTLEPYSGNGWGCISEQQAPSLATWWPGPDGLCGCGFCDEHAPADPATAQLPDSDSDSDYTNQQTWASMAYDVLRESLLPDAPERAIITYGFPSVANAARGETWLTEAMGAEASGALKKDSKAVIFIHPSQWDDPSTVLMVLTHEMIHACGAMNHGAPYAAVAKAIGLGESKPGIFDVVEQSLAAQFLEIIDMLPSFPSSAMTPHDTPIPHGGGAPSPTFAEPTDFCHGGTKIDPNNPPSPPKPQKCRQRLHECRCGQKIRAARDEANATCDLCHTAYKLKPRKTKGATT